ncbi:MAG: hypothetical protein ACXW3Z_11745 [Limisphaerales bacterium]
MIPSDDINVGADVAFCRSCNVSHPLSGVARGTGIDPQVDLTRPPKGTWHRASGLGTVIGASHRSVGGAIGALAFAAFWNGIVSIFVAVALASTLALLGVPRPGWFPAPVMNGGAMGVGITIFLWLFLTPFIAVGLAMIAAFFSCLAGRTEIQVKDWQGEVFSGVGPIGWRRKFKTEMVKDVRIDDKQWRDSDGDHRRNTQVLNEMTEGKAIKFGSSLNHERRQFVAAALRQALIK